MTRDTPPHPLIGRQRDIQALEALLEEHRLVTILGPAGMGKTSLARQLAHQRGAPMVELAHAHDMDAFCAALVDRLRLAVPPSDDAQARAQQIGDQLEDQGVELLVLDNLEQLTHLATPLLQQWLQQAPELHLLVTSRHRLPLRQARLHNLEPLSLPGGQADGDAVALFLERARALDPDYASHPGDLDAIRQVVRRLDGIPLAIELAAARARTLSPVSMLERLDERFALLSLHSLDIDARQEVLESALEWSWVLLEPWEQQALAQLSVLEEGFPLQAAEAVLAPSPQEPPALDALESLLDKSLLRAWRGPGGQRQFGFYESIRAFGARKLRLPPHDQHPGQAAGRYRRWAAQQARRGQPPAQSHLQAALRLCLDSDPPEAEATEQALHLALALDPLMSTRGPLAAWEQTLTQLLARPMEGLDALQARVREALGNLARTRGHLEGALEHLATARALAAGCKDAAAEASVIASMGIALHERGRLEQAQSHHQEALARFEALGDRRQQARALGSLAILHHEQGRLRQAEQSYHLALQILGQEGDARSQAIFTISLGDLHKEERHLALAHQCYQRALALLEGAPDPRVEAVILGNLGGLALEEGQLEEAAQLHQQAIERLKKVGDIRLEKIFTGYLGLGRHLQGNVASAWMQYQDAMLPLRQAGDLRHEAIFQGYLGVAEVALGRQEGARRALERAGELLAQLGDQLLQTAHALHRAHLEPPPQEELGRLLGRARRDAQRSDEVRHALELWQRRSQEQSQPVLRVSQDARSFWLPDGEEVSLGRRRAPRLLLQRLCQQRLQEPGEGLSVYDLMEAGWPGEELHPESGTNRVYVALNTLRKMGLRQLLLHRDDGYLLDPEVALEVS